MPLDFNDLGSAITSNDYTDFSNKPQVNSVTLTGNKSTSDLGIDGSNINATYEGNTDTLNNIISALVTRIESLETLIDAGNITARE